MEKVGNVLEQTGYFGSEMETGVEILEEKCKHRDRNIECF